MELDGSVPTSPITGSADLAFDGSGTITGAGVLAGTAVLAIGADGSLVATIAGTASLAFGASGHLHKPRTQLHPHAVIGRRYGNFERPPGRIAGTASFSFGASATPFATVSIAGTASLAFGASVFIPRFTTQLLPHMWPGRRYGDFDRSLSLGSIEGSASLTFGGSGLLTGNVEILGVADLTFGGSGSLAGVGGLAGSTSVSFGASGLPRDSSTRIWRVRYAVG
jgi:hypothetical protein